MSWECISTKVWQGGEKNRDNIHQQRENQAPLRTRDLNQGDLGRQGQACIPRPYLQPCLEAFLALVENYDLSAIKSVCVVLIIIVKTHTALTMLHVLF